MSVNCITRLPGNVRVNDVRTVIGALIGFKTVREDFLSGSGWHAVNKGVDFDRSYYSSPEAGSIAWVDALNYKRHVYWSFEGDNNTRLLYPSSTAFWCALSARLVEFFGGDVNFCDVDDDIDLSYPPKSDAENRPKCDPEWSVLQQRILDLKPISATELKSFEDKAAYGADDYAYLFDKDGYMVIPNRTSTKKEVA